MSDFVLNLIGLGLSIPFSLFGWWVVAKVWRYRGTNISDVMPHAGFSDADKLGYARGALSATTMLTLLPFMFAGAVLEDFLASRGVDWDFMPVLGVMIGGIMLTAVLTFLTKHFYWPRMLIPPAFRERPHERQ